MHTVNKAAEESVLTMTNHTVSQRAQTLLVIPTYYATLHTQHRCGLLRARHNHEPRKTSLNQLSVIGAWHTQVGRSNHLLYGCTLVPGATWRIQWINFSSVGDAARRYHYCSSLIINAVYEVNELGQDQQLSD